MALADSAGLIGTGSLGVALGDVALKHLAVGGTDDFCLLGTRQTRPHFKQLASLGGQGVDRRQLQALLHRTPLALLGAGSRDGQLLQQHVEAVDGHLTGFRTIPQ